MPKTFRVAMKKKIARLSNISCVCGVHIYPLLWTQAGVSDQAASGGGAFQPWLWTQQGLAVSPQSSGGFSNALATSHYRDAFGDTAGFSPFGSRCEGRPSRVDTGVQMAPPGT
jgi:hypothetical protein